MFGVESSVNFINQKYLNIVHSQFLNQQKSSAGFFFQIKIQPDNAIQTNNGNEMCQMLEPQNCQQASKSQKNLSIQWL